MNSPIQAFRMLGYFTQQYVELAALNVVCMFYNIIYNSIQYVYSCIYLAQLNLTTRLYIYETQV